MKRTLWLWSVLIALLVAGCETSGGPGDNGGDSGPTLPVYKVTQSGASSEQATGLNQELNINATLLEEGVVDYFDPERFAFVPTVSFGTAVVGEEEREVVREGIDFDALASLEVPEPDSAEATLRDALQLSKLASLFPEAHSYTRQQTVFEARVDQGATVVANQEIDTRVAVEFALGDEQLPLIGPGAVVYATFDANGATSFRYAFRGLEAGESVPVLTDEEALQQCRNALGSESAEELTVSTKTVYYAPPLELRSVGTVLPHVECSGTISVGGEEVALLQELLPAVQSEEYVPSATITASADGSSVTANVDVSGGLAPYTVEWSSANVSFSGAPTSPDETLTYEVSGREAVAEETLVATVTDANGVQVRASETLSLEALSAGSTMTPTVGGVEDFGTENSVTNEFGALESGFIDEMTADGVVERFSWTGKWAWEQDFKETSDNSQIDDTDITFYVGHGYGGGFTFEDDSHDDSRLRHTEADGAWGNRDLEWLALYSCQVLKDEWDGKSYFSRWWNEFDGLHMIVGFHTNAYVRSKFSKKFADNLVDDNMKVRNAWFRAVDNTQPEGVVARVLGVYGETVSSVNDHFWGRGPVSQDIRGADAYGRWSLTRTVR